MANRDFKQDINSCETKLCKIMGRFVSGGVGVQPTQQKWQFASGPGNGTWVTTTNGALGIASIVKGTAGKYTITLGPNPADSTKNDIYVRLLSVAVSFNTSGVADVVPAAPLWAITDDSVSSSTFQITFYNTSGVATDPAALEIINLEITLGDSTTP